MHACVLAGHDAGLCFYTALENSSDFFSWSRMWGLASVWTSALTVSSCPNLKISPTAAHSHRDPGRVHFCFQKMPKSQLRGRKGKGMKFGVECDRTGDCFAHCMRVNCCCAWPCIQAYPNIRVQPVLNSQPLLFVGFYCFSITGAWSLGGGVSN